MRKPDMVIGPSDRPYLLRWYLIPRNRWCNLYLHCFVRDDDDRALHDHPWWFWSLILWGRYSEVVPHSPRPSDLDAGVIWPQYAEIRRNCLSLAFRRAEHRHRVVLPRRLVHRQSWPQQPIIGFDQVPCWTLVLTGRRTREWGFWCPQGWRSWKIFTKPENPGEIGRGCG